MIEITLTDAEMKLMELAGCWRLQNAQEHARNAGLGPSSYNPSPEFHISGCQAEYAVSLYLNLYWRPHIGRVRELDVGGKVNVRSTKRLDGRLIIKPADMLVPFVLALQSGATFSLAGWCEAEYAKKNYPLLSQFGDPAHFVPQGVLQEMPLLKSRIRD